MGFLLQSNWYFQCALAAALVNIKLPLMVGDVVNVVSKFAKDSTGDFMAEIKKPALKLVGTYLIQVSILLNSGIILEGDVGEEVLQNCPTSPCFNLGEKFIYIVYIERIFQKIITSLQN